MKISDVTVEIECRRPLEVLGLGAGTQSTTLALMESYGSISKRNAPACVKSERSNEHAASIRVPVRSAGTRRTHL